MTTYVLVHGALHGAWCWQRIAGPLRDAGRAVSAVDLPGRGEKVGAADFQATIHHGSQHPKSLSRSYSRSTRRGHDMGASANEQFVREFFAAMGPTLEDFKRNYRVRMAEDVVWETVGLPAHRGRDACVAYLDDLHARTGMEYCAIEMRHIATAGDVVLTERIDAMYRADGTKIMEFRLMGAIELRDGLIARYTDYLDTVSITAGLPNVAATVARR